MKNCKLYILILLLSSSWGYSQKAIDTPSKGQKLDSKQLAYIQKSESNVKDLYAYLEVISNPEIDAKLKENTKNQVKKLFNNQDYEIPDLMKDQKQIRLYSFMDEMANSKQKIKFEVNSISETQFHLNKWILQYRLKVNDKSYNIKQNAFYITEEKSFGKQKSREVVSIYLGDITFL